MKKQLAKITSALLTVLMLTTSVFAASASDFTDVNLDAWYGDTLTYAVDHSMVNGKSATTFAPYDTMTRSQFISVFGRAMAGSGSNTYKFADVDNNAYYIPYLYWGVENGIINGTGDTTFSPNSPITRQDMATIVGRAIGNLRLNVAAGDKIADGFQDASAISGYAQPSVELLRTLGIVNGDNNGNFNPKKNMTRIEGTAVLVRLVQQIQPSATPTDPTQSQKNALERAKSYLRVSAFSRTGLIEQLEYEGYSTEDATYASDNCGADWYEQALKKAQSYLRSSSFSYTRLIEQLEFEDFTSEQAIYGVDNCGADWYEQAVKKAKDYLDYTFFSYDGLVSQLEFEGFTHDQAVYAANQTYQ